MPGDTGNHSFNRTPEGFNIDLGKIEDIRKIFSLDIILALGKK